MQAFRCSMYFFHLCLAFLTTSQAAPLRPIARWKLDDLYSNTIYESTGFYDDSCAPGQLFGQTHGGWPMSARWNANAGIVTSPSGKGALRMHSGGANGREYATLSGLIVNSDSTYMRLCPHLNLLRMCPHFVASRLPTTCLFTVF